jgi:hypothetical protein
MLPRSHTVIASLLAALAAGAHCPMHGGAERFTGMVQYRTKRETSKVAAFERYDDRTS